MPDRWVLLLQQIEQRLPDTTSAKQSRACSALRDLPVHPVQAAPELLGRLVALEVLGGPAALLDLVGPAAPARRWLPRLQGDGWLKSIPCCPGLLPWPAGTQRR